jgi:phosphoribosylglycinamide formyltransferase-1
VPDTPLRLAVLVSGSGTNLQALVDAVAADPGFGGEIVVVGSDRRGAQGLRRAAAAGVPTFAVEVGDFAERADWEAALVERLLDHRTEAVVLAGFMRLVSDRFLAHWPDRVVNTHPSLLPAFRGAHAVRDALAYGVKVTGSTVHLVDAEVDHGPVIAQRAVEVRDDDTEESLHERIKAVEHELLPASVGLLCQGRLVVEGRHVRVRG